MAVNVLKFFHEDFFNNGDIYLLWRRHNPEIVMALTNNRWSGYMFHRFEDYDYFQSRL